MKKTAEADAKRAEEEKKKTEKALKEREKIERERSQREQEKTEKEHHKHSKRGSVSRKMSLGLSGWVSWPRDKDKHPPSTASSSIQSRSGAEGEQNGLKAEHIDSAATQKMLKTENYFTPTINF